MAILKATVRFRNKSGLYPVYIRFTQVKQVSYVKTSWMVNDKGINERKEIIDPFVIKPKSVIRISLCRTAKRNPLIFPI